MKLAVNRRAVLGSAALSGLAQGVDAAFTRSGGQRTVANLRVDHLSSPLSIESRRSRLSWQVTGSEQASYRIRVAREHATLASGRADLWDSGRVKGGTMLDVAYTGTPLASGERAFWQVESWDASGNVTRSAIDYWQAGLLEPAAWEGAWLAAESEELAGDRAAGLYWIWSSDGTTKAPQLFRSIIEIPDTPLDAVLQVVARDAIDGVWLNGEPVERRPFRPGVVNNARMETISLPLRKGRNELTIGATYHPERGPLSPTGGMAAVIRVRHTDNRLERLTTRGWQVATGSGDKTGTAASAWSIAQPAGSKPENDPWAAGPAMLLRRRFIARRPIARATLYATALGAYYIHLNGRRIGRALLAPESTDFTKRVLYQAHDVTQLIRAGENMVGAIVGDGWYGSTGLFGGRFDFGPAPCRFRGQVVIKYRDGTGETIASDALWEMAPSAVIASEIYDGEIYDARREQIGWDLPLASREGWHAASVAETPTTAVVAQVDPPIRVTRTLTPVSVKEVRSGVFVADFGQNFAGWCAIEGHATAGTEVTLRFAEILKPSGEVDQSNLRSAAARDIFTFAGTGRERYQPHFTYHGFRYVQIEGWKGSLPDDFLSGEVIHSDLPETGLFRIDDPLVQKLWLNTLWSQRSNFIGIPTDCPQRDERLGWMGDAQVFWDAASFNMDVAAFTRRFMGDVRDAQAANGAFAEYNPQSLHAGMKGAPGWADAGVILPWTVWRRFGDTAIIEENWQAMTAYAGFVMRNNPDFVWRKERGTDYGDWLALDAKEPGDPTTPKDLVATAMWASATAKMADMAQAIGREDEASSYRQRLLRISRAFAAAFLKPDGTLGNGSQTGYLLALRHDLLPTNGRAAAARNLVADIRHRGTVLSTGFLGTPIALDVLLDLGERDLVYALLRRTEYPSWGYMVSKGATTIWERWNGDAGDISMNSFNHYALGAIVGFFYRRLAGIDVIKPGFASILIAPETRIGFKDVSATFDSPVGRIETRWRRDGSTTTLDVSVPVGGSAELRLPANEGAVAMIGGKRVPTRSGIIAAPLAAGQHSITIRG